MHTCSTHYATYIHDTCDCVGLCTVVLWYCGTVVLCTVVLYDCTADMMSTGDDVPVMEYVNMMPTANAACSQSYSTTVTQYHSTTVVQYHSTQYSTQYTVQYIITMCYMMMCMLLYVLLKHVCMFYTTSSCQQMT